MDSEAFKTAIIIEKEISEGVRQRPAPNEWIHFNISDGREFRLHIREGNGYFDFLERVGNFQQIGIDPEIQFSQLEINASESWIKSPKSK